VRGPTNGGERRRLLIVDDEKLLLRSLSRALQHEYEVVTTSSPIEALRLASSGEHWDIVLSDVTMPGMSGIELASRLSSSCPALVGRIVLMTGGARTEHAHSVLERCGLTVITKPIDMSHLLRVLATVGSDSE
jgi:CheY-like chemotaxis protein